MLGFYFWLTKFSLSVNTVWTLFLEKPVGLFTGIWMIGHMDGYFKLKSLVHFVSKCILLYIDFFCYKHGESVLDVLALVIIIFVFD